MKRVIVLAWVCAWSMLGFAEALNVSGFTRKMNITFSGCANESVPLTNFPALVEFPVGFDYSGFMSANGDDLRFADVAGNELSYEIDTWDTSGRSLVWVRVPELVKDTVITVYWGKPLPAPVYEDDANVWSSGYLAVYHFSAGREMKDSSRYGNDLTTKVGVTQGAGGLLGAAPQFATAPTGAKGHYYSAPHSDSLGAASKELTLEGWTFDTNATSQNDWHRTMVTKRKDANTAVEYGFGLFKLGSTTASANLKWNHNSGSTRTGFAEGSAVNQWVHIASTFNAEAAEPRASLYVNGALLKTGNNAATTIPQTTMSPLYIGVLDPAAAGCWVGQLDEIRISNVARSAEWMAATAQTAKSPAAFAVNSTVEIVVTEEPVAEIMLIDVLPEGVSLNGVLGADGGAATSLKLCYGRINGGETLAEWEGVEDLGVQPIGVFSTMIEQSELRYDKQYYCRLYAENANSVAVWSPVKTFVTWGVPVLSDMFAYGTQTAIETGITLTDLGAAPSVTVKLYWGTASDDLELIQSWPDLTAAQELTFSPPDVVQDVAYYCQFTVEGLLPGDDEVTVVASEVLEASVLQGKHGVWTSALDGNWIDVANWQDGIIATGATYTATISADLTANRVITLGGGGWTVGHLAASNTSATVVNRSWTLAAPTQEFITYDAGGQPSIVDVGSNTVLISGIFTAKNDIIKRGPGIFRLVSRNNGIVARFLNTIWVEEGTFGINEPFCLEGMTVALGGADESVTVNSTENSLTGTLGQEANTTGLRNGGKIKVLAGGSGKIEFRYYSSPNDVLYWPPIELGKTVHVHTESANTFSLGGRISGAGGFYKTGAGKFFLYNNQNSFSGPITVSQGSLLVWIYGSAIPAGKRIVLGDESTGNSAVYFQVSGDTSVGSDRTFVFTDTGSTGGAGFAKCWGHTGDSAIQGAVQIDRNITIANATDTSRHTYAFAGVISGVGRVAYTSDVAKAATITLSGRNTYEGGSIINSGTVIVSNNGCLGTGDVTLTHTNSTLKLSTSAESNNADFNGISDTATLSMIAGSKIDFSGIAGEDKKLVAENVGKFYLDGKLMFRGTYGATGSGARYINDDLFVGAAGVLQVTDGPAPETILFVQ